MPANKIFVSYDHSEDAHYKNLFGAWDANPNFDFEIDVRSPSVAIDSTEAAVIKASLTKKMKESEYILVLLGAKTSTSKWMKWEIDRAKESDINLKFVAVRLSAMNVMPSNLPSNTAIAAKFEVSLIEKAIAEAKSAR